jgi:chromosome segregation ATPase
MQDNKMESMADLLPEGLSEDTVNEICSLVSDIISEQVDTKIRLLEAKVQGFLRMKMDSIKEHAIKELEMENETYKNAKIYESLKTLMALELRDQDKDNAVSLAVEEQTQTEEERNLLVDELNNSLIENSKLENLVVALKNKVGSLEESKTYLSSELETLAENISQPFHSSERAVVLTENVDKENKVSPAQATGNEWLTEDIMAFMPSEEL